MGNSKHFRTGIKKFKKGASILDSTQSVQNQVPQVVEPQTLAGLHQIAILTHCFDDYTQDGQLDYISKLFNAMRAIDISLIKSICSDIEPHYEHRIDKSTSYEMTKINVKVDIKSQCRLDSKNNILDYLHKGRHALLSHNYNNKDYFDDLLRKITELAIDVDEKIHVNASFPYNKHVNRISIARAIEKLSLIKKSRNTEYIFGIKSSVVGTYDVKSVEKRKAIDLLGGKYMSKSKSEFYFTVKTIDFTNIESKLVFLLDGSPVNVYITDEKWIKLFNDEKIKLTKNERIRAKYLVERSPLTNKIVAYYFTDIHIDPTKL